ncbi:Bulb-type lectin domain superfamily [Arabidopsis thaliana x Arabidopsis arenosa]|uniref:Receptor-like serine/threonine-protein kinase n=1 Tax=Arabidopsis thaliana x Arabidopsis arenosa TaxID=1240361 RepID=A0A8T2BGF1_9BRAS|nr:Bulb-type lectin domain superfamily [Arabidopsis thaliana x Arabidopsis arenosa]
MGKKRIMFFASLLLFTIFLSFSYAGITRESPLSIGQTLSSSNGVYELGFFSPNNSHNQYVGIWFKGIIPQVVVWVANREKPVTSSTANLTISSNGSLLLFNENNSVVWSIGEIFASNGSRAELTDNGNLVVIDNASGRTLWESFEHFGDTILPFSTMMYNLATGEKRVLTSWKSHTDPSPGDFMVQITPQVPSQACTMRGSTTYWRSGPWAKTRFTGIPVMDDTYTSPFSLQQDANGSGSFTYFERNFKRSYIMITSEGSLKIFQHNGRDWELNFEAPENSCDFYGLCGPFGFCVNKSVPSKCKCFEGFVPKYIEEWKRGNWTDGCVRRTELHCQGNSTGKNVNDFYHIANIKPPDFYEFASFVNAEGCYQICLHNCSCLAFSYINGIGCLMWNQDLMDAVQFSAGGEILSIRLASSELGGNKRNKIIVASIVSLSLFVILAFAAFCFWRYRVKHNVSAKTSKIASEEAWKNDLEPQDVSGLKFFEMNTIQTATNNFSLSNKLGQGGFGSVYKGNLQDGKEIAVKRLSSSSGQGKEEFMNEIVLISKLQHKNLVRILGCCIEGEERLLIYEFLLNKSLDTFLFDSRKRLEIDWPKRFNIIKGIARGLHYLHRDSCLRVIHRDLKVSNILLDEKMNPKISDFGLARMYQGTEYQDNTRRVAGTLGYMSPEYAWTGMFSEKSDIYSFGVLLLEIISGEKISRFSYGDEGKTLIAYAWECWSGTGGVDLLDQDVADSCHPVEVERCVQIGLLCVQHQPADRPNTLELLSMLTTTSELPSPKQPTFVLHTIDDESPAKSLYTVNEMTQSVILGR